MEQLAEIFGLPANDLQSLLMMAGIFIVILFVMNFVIKVARKIMRMGCLVAVSAIILYFLSLNFL